MARKSESKRLMRQTEAKSYRGCIFHLKISLSVLSYYGPDNFLSMMAREVIYQVSSAITLSKGNSIMQVKPLPKLVPYGKYMALKELS